MKLVIDPVRTHLCRICTKSPGSCGADRAYGDKEKNVIACHSLRLNTRIRAGLQELLATRNSPDMDKVLASDSPFMAIQADMDWDPEIFSEVKNLLRDQEG